MLLWARVIVLKTEEQYESHYRSSLSTTAKKQIGLIPSIRYQRPADCVFPWDVLVNQRQVPNQQPTPPLNPVVPDIPIMVDYNQQTENPFTAAPTVVEPIVQVANYQPQPEAEQPPVQAQPTGQRRRRRRRSSESTDSSASYEENNQRVRPAVQEQQQTRSTQETAVDNTARDILKIQELLRTFAPKLKYQRFHDNRPIQQLQTAKSNT